MVRRALVVISAVALGAAGYQLVDPVDATTSARATWTCGSVVSPKPLGPVTGPSAEVLDADDHLFFVAGQAACGEARDRRAGDASGSAALAAAAALPVALARRRRTLLPEPVAA